jgi:hypothetical protein
MRPSLQSQISKSKEHALAAFIARKGEFDDALARLQALSDDHFHYSPDEITWCHGGTLQHYTALLKRITDMAFNAGEHAEYASRSPAHGPARPAAAGAQGRRRAMVLSDGGDPPMTKLSDTQLVILSAAAQRTDLSILPLPQTLSLKGGALNKVMDSLRNRGLIRVFFSMGALR